MSRSVWEWGHRLLGLFVIGLGLYTVSLGIGKYKLFYGDHTSMGVFVWTVVAIVYALVMAVIIYAKSKYMRRVIWATLFHRSDDTEGDALMTEDTNFGGSYFKKVAKFADPSTTQRNLLAGRSSMIDTEYDAGIHAALAEAQDWQQKQDDRKQRRNERRSKRRSKRRTGKRKKKDGTTANPNPDGTGDDGSNDGFSSDDGGISLDGDDGFASDDGQKKSYMDLI